METNRTNIFIVDDNKLMLMALKQYLENRFGVSVIVSPFSDGESCLKKVDKHTNIVILDYYLDGNNKTAKNGIEILKSIKEINPKAEVIMLSSNEDIGVAIESFRRGATDYVVKGDKAWEKLITLVNNVITEPIRIIVREFGIPKFLVLFLLVFIGMATVVYWVMKLIS